MTILSTLLEKTLEDREAVTVSRARAKSLAQLKIVEISPARYTIRTHLAELWEYRELIYNFVLRDLTTRYKQTILGVAWAVIQPVFMMIVFTIFFGKFMHAPTENCPYPIFALAALLVWQYTSSAVSRATNSLLGAGGLMKKVYFPKLTVPIASVALPMVDFCIGFTLFLLMMPFFGVVPTARILLLPIYFGLMVATALGIGLWTSALHVKYRDIYHIVPFVLQLWFFASPVAYACTIVPPHLQLLFDLNPLVGIIEGTRWCLLDTTTQILLPTLFAAGVAFLLVASGFWYFMSTEDAFADYV
ncbi:MAG: ABC transporter permease [Candidatus Melainabacteria bacterium]|nr:ABC transporter permease [Candidatus Melainabacteria bacterium]